MRQSTLTARMRAIDEGIARDRAEREARHAAIAALCDDDSAASEDYPMDDADRFPPHAPFR